MTMSRNIISLFVIFLLILNISVAASVAGSTSIPDQGNAGSTKATISQDYGNQTSTDQNLENQTQASSQIEDVQMSINSANETLQTLKKLLEELNLSNSLANLTVGINRARKELTRGEVKKANETITEVWLGIANVANETKTYLRKNFYNPLEPKVKTCKDDQRLWMEFNSVNKKLNTINSLLKEGKVGNYLEIKKAVSLLEEAKSLLDNVQDEIKACFGIVLLKKAFITIEQYQNFLGVNNKTIKELNNTITNAENAFKKGNLSVAIKIIDLTKQQILNITNERYGELKREFEPLKNSSSYCSGNKTLVSRIEGVNKELLIASKNINIQNFNITLASLKKVQDNLEILKKDVAECLIKKAGEKVAKLNTTYVMLPPEYYNATILPLNSKLKEAKDALKKGNYDNSIKLSIEIINESKFQSIKKIILRIMRKKLNVNKINITEQELTELEMQYKLVQKRLQTVRKKKLALQIINPESELSRAEEDLKKANSTLSILKAYFNATNAKKPEDLIKAVKKFDFAFSKGSSQVNNMFKNTTIVNGTQVEKLLNEATGYISTAENKYTWNKVLLTVILLFLLAGIGYGSYTMYTSYQEKKRVNEAEAAIETMKEILQELSVRMRQLGLVTNDRVRKIIEEMNNLIARAQEEFERGNYMMPISLKNMFIAKYDILKTWIEPYEKTLKLDLSKHVAANSYIGRRQNNEDAYIAEKIGGNILLAVADGMGGHLAGEVASRKAIEILRETLEKNKFGDPEEILREAITRANRVIYQMGHDPAHPERYNMGTTLTAAIIRGDTATIANIGDSRTYLIKPDGTIKRLTKDHSLVQELIDRGEITEKEARRHPQKNVITKALGIAKDIRIDKGDIKKVTLRKGDYLLLCSDGLTDSLIDEEIARIVISSPSLEEAARILVDKAYGYGSDDNITVVLYRH